MYSNSDYPWSIYRETESITEHARTRMSQRNLSRADVTFVMEHGTILHRAGAIFYYLRKNDIPRALRRNKDLRRLEGTTLVFDTDESVLVTVYRKRDGGLKHIRKKLERSAHRLH